MLAPAPWVAPRWRAPMIILRPRPRPRPLSSSPTPLSAVSTAPRTSVRPMLTIHRKEIHSLLFRANLVTQGKGGGRREEDAKRCPPLPRLSLSLFLSHPPPTHLLFLLLTFPLFTLTSFKAAPVRKSGYSGIEVGVKVVRATERGVVRGGGGIKEGYKAATVCRRLNMQSAYGSQCFS